MTYMETQRSEDASPQMEGMEHINFQRLFELPRDRDVEVKYDGEDVCVRVGSLRDKEGEYFYCNIYVPGDYVRRSEFPCSLRIRPDGRLIDFYLTRRAAWLKAFLNGFREAC
ncbi:MAG: hypothetical protein ABIH78_04830 [Candidatus Peregrinibacteria bacterium]